MSNLRYGIFAIAAVSLLAACSQAEPVFHPEENPQRLSDWGLFSLAGNKLTPSATTQVFRPANTLFTDYAQKLRTLWIPDGNQARLVDEEIDYPVGTVVSKTFYYPADASGNLQKLPDARETEIDLQQNKLIETRLLVRRESGWDAFPYVWNDEQTEAFLRVAGTSKAMSLHGNNSRQDFVYFVPNENQCSGCHITEHPDGDMHPLGAVAEQLMSKISNNNGETELQIETLQARGWLDQLPALQEPPAWPDESADLTDRAQAYLNMNCGHCHNPQGAADTSGLILDGAHDIAVNMGVCKPPVAAGGGSGSLRYSIVPGAPEQSILLYRMESDEPDEMMPELGRSLIHSEGLQLIRDWITAMPGACQNL